MTRHQKKVGGDKVKSKKEIPQAARHSTINETPVWRFDKLDRDGKFKFDLLRQDFNHKEILSKLVEYGNLKWSEIDRQTHDESNKTKHHLLDYNKLSREAKERIRETHNAENSDIIFSFALMNKLRIIGLRERAEFHIVWYDPEHEFCPSTR